MVSWTASKQKSNSIFVELLKDSKCKRERKNDTKSGEIEKDK